MPIYEFRCSSCGNQFEQLILQGSELEGIKCPKCLEPNPKRVLSVFCSSTGGVGETSQRASSASCGSPSSRFS